MRLVVIKLAERGQSLWLIGEGEGALYTVLLFLADKKTETGKCLERKRCSRNASAVCLPQVPC